MIKQLSSDEFNLTHILTNNLQSVQAKKNWKKRKKEKEEDTLPRNPSCGPSITKSAEYTSNGFGSWTKK